MVPRPGNTTFRHYWIKKCNRFLVYLYMYFVKCCGSFVRVACPHHPFVRPTLMTCSLERARGGGGGGKRDLKWRGEKRAWLVHTQVKKSSYLFAAWAAYPPSVTLYTVHLEQKQDQCCDYIFVLNSLDTNSYISRIVCSVDVGKIVPCTWTKA